MCDKQKSSLGSKKASEKTYDCDDPKLEDIIAKHDFYGSTPPRSRIRGKNKDKKQKMEGSTQRANRLSRMRSDRRNTMDCAILNALIIEPNEANRTDKRTVQLRRSHDREEKFSLASVSHQRSSLYQDDATASNRLSRSKMVQPEVKVSIKTRPSALRSSWTNFDASKDPLKTRKDFHDTFSNLIKLGSMDCKEKTKSVVLSPIDPLQTEVQNLIWLELQAYHADRSLEEQDLYLSKARQSVGDLLDEIMKYKYQRKSRLLSVASTVDSGIEDPRAPCFGCLSMYCKDCLEAQTSALKQVEHLLIRLESAESLFPSSESFGNYYPLYKSREFVDRIKAMCLWYNITKNHRLKILILGKIIAKVQDKQYNWPITEGSSSSTEEHDESGKNSSQESNHGVTFDGFGSAGEDTCDDVLESDSDKSDKRTSQFYVVNEYGRLMSTLSQASSMGELDNFGNSRENFYRKFIENVLKSRGLGKSLNFLHRLHNVVLKKAHVTLEKPGTEDCESDSDIFEDDNVPVIEPPLDKEQEDELRRYGVWSPEYAELALPSYTPAFIFLSMISLRILHEFLKMKLETKRTKPNPLSLEQLMKELKEGLTLAVIHRDRFNKHIGTALVDRETEMEIYMKIIDEFDATLKEIFRLYLDYVEQWILSATPETHRKAAMDEEWRFIRLVSPMITDEHAEAAQKFSFILQDLLRAIGNRLESRVNELDSYADCLGEEVFEEDLDEIKSRLYCLCRDTQQLFSIEREKSLKVMTFIKSWIRDVEKADFHRDHNEFITCDNEKVCYRHSQNFMCSEVIESIKCLKATAFELRDKLNNTIMRVQEKSDSEHIAHLGEFDKISIISRTRQILHQGYKFGFEFHKDLFRVFDTTNDADCNYSLAKAFIDFARQWMKFVIERCERGRGLRPKWAYQGLDFLQTACEPRNTCQITDAEFEVLKSEMDKCISHIVGSSEPDLVKRSPREKMPSRMSSSPIRSRTPTPLKSITNPKFPQQLSVNENVRPMSDISNGLRSQKSFDNTLRVPENLSGMNSPETPELRKVRVRDAVNHLERNREENLRKSNLIGQVKINNSDKVVLRTRTVKFSWHRGIKIGQGRFGKVYTAVNNTTGELMAMKEISIQAGVSRAIQKVANELKIFEGINHRHLVKYYGIEIHREELLIFMELCAEGTLESLVEMSGGLHEGITRRYTRQLLSAAELLHRHGVVHRDIKPANIFLTNDGNHLKLGDFGSAAKIQSSFTVQGELRSYVGTQAYMAPEVFTKNDTEGYGRTADIWSIGCTVLEMAAGKRPWHQYDSNYSIMFQVGSGKIPEIPEILSQEGHDFIHCCLLHDPQSRWSAERLLEHNFCKVTTDKDDQDPPSRKTSRTK